MFVFEEFTTASDFIVGSFMMFFIVHMRASFE